MIYKYSPYSMLLYFHGFVCSILFFGDKISLCSPCWPGTCDPPVSASQMRGLRLCNFYFFSFSFSFFFLLLLLSHPSPFASFYSPHLPFPPLSHCSVECVAFSNKRAHLSLYPQGRRCGPAAVETGSTGLA